MASFWLRKTFTATKDTFKGGVQSYDHMVTFKPENFCADNEAPSIVVESNLILLN